MPKKAEKTLIASKHATVITSYTTGLAVSPAANSIAIYTDLVLADQHRLLEVQERLKDVINRAREEGYRRPSSGTCFWRMPFNGSRADIVFTLVSTEIVEGDVAIGMAGTVRGGGRGSIILDSCWSEIIAWTGEQDGLVA